CIQINHLDSEVIRGLFAFSVSHITLPASRNTKIFAKLCSDGFAKIFVFLSQRLRRNYPLVGWIDGRIYAIAGLTTAGVDVSGVPTYSYSHAETANMESSLLFVRNFSRTFSRARLYRCWQRKEIIPGAK